MVEVDICMHSVRPPQRLLLKLERLGIRYLADHIVISSSRFRKAVEVYGLRDVALLYPGRQEVWFGKFCYILGLNGVKPEATIVVELDGTTEEGPTDGQRAIEELVEVVRPDILFKNTENGIYYCAYYGKLNLLVCTDLLHDTRGVETFEKIVDFLLEYREGGEGEEPVII